MLQFITVSLTVILGAGATRGVEHIDPELPPPLLPEFPQVVAAAFDFLQPRRLEQSQLSWYFEAITSNPSWPDDFEAFMTSLELGKAIISVQRSAIQADPSSIPPSTLQAGRALMGREDDNAISLALEVS